MKVPFYQYLVVLTVCCMSWAMPAFSQTKTNSVLDLKVRPTTRAFVQPSPTSVVASVKAKVSDHLIVNCDNDQTPPDIHCPSGNCNPLARAAYLTSSYGEPWGLNDNIYTMDVVFGSGNWDYINFGFSDVGLLFSNSYKVIFLDGSDNGGFELNNFLTNNRTLIENWVAAGGALFLNAAPNNTPDIIDFGFDGVTLTHYGYSNNGYVQAPDNVIFNQPYAPANGDFTGNYFNLAWLSGNVGQVLITTAPDPTAPVCLSVKNWGQGKVYFGTIALPSWDGPMPNIQNMWQNILADLNTVCNNYVYGLADADQCFATIADQSLDATATDDCNLASLTHNVAGAPSSTTLVGAILPVGLTTVVWTATDAAGNTSTCETPVFIREQEAPAITCPQDISVNADAGHCSATADYAVTATDNCSATPLLYYNYAPGSTIPFGATTIIAYASDASGNRSSCSFVFNVLPNPEICNGFDDDCDGWTDEDVTDLQTFYRDADYDGYGNPNETTTNYGCYPPYGYVNNALDCDDSNYYIHPNAYEYCNGVDDNCDGNIDEGVTPTWYQDADGDGYGNPNVTISSCDQPQGYVYYGTDCDDTEAYIHPGALEDCTNTADENCDGILGDNNFSIEETHADVFCGSTPDGKISITLTPAQNYPVILWSNGMSGVTDITNLQAGTYKVTVSNECGTTKTKTIVIQPSPTPALQVAMTGTAQICGGSATGTITATPSDGCGNYTYEWPNGSTETSLSDLWGGYYSVVVTDACGCSQTSQFFIQQMDPVGLYANVIVPLLDGTYFVQVVPYGGTAPYQFRRSDNGDFTPWGPSNGFIGVPAGDIVFEVKDNIGCTTQITITLSPLSPQPMTGGDEDAEKTDAGQRSDASVRLDNEHWAISLFPNPNTGVFNVTLPQNTKNAVTLYLTDVTGRIVYTQKVEAGNSQPEVQASNLPPGTYFLQVFADSRIMAVEKVEKQ